MRKVAAIVFLWLLCGYAASGATYSYFQGEYGDVETPRETAATSLIMIPFGPIALFVSFALTGAFEHGVALSWPMCPKIPLVRR